MKFEELRKAVEEAENVLRDKHDLQDNDIDRLANAHWLGSFVWSQLSARGKDDIGRYLDRIKELAIAERAEIEELRRRL